MLSSFARYLSLCCTRKEKKNKFMLEIYLPKFPMWFVLNCRFTRGFFFFLSFSSYGIHIFFRSVMAFFILAWKMFVKFLSMYIVVLDLSFAQLFNGLANNCSFALPSLSFFFLVIIIYYGCGIALGHVSMNEIFFTLGSNIYELLPS